MHRLPTLTFSLVVGLLGAATVAGGALAAVPPDAVEIENLAIAEPVADAPGDPVNGRQVFADRSLGNCLACHANTDLSEEGFHGEVGPALDGVADRWTEQQLRTIVVNSKAVFTENSIMPAFYSLDVGENVRDDLVGKTILTAQEVEDVVAYLTTLK